MRENNADHYFLIEFANILPLVNQKYINKTMKSALMVAEKPSLAASLAKILSDGKNSTRKGRAVCEKRKAIIAWLARSNLPAGNVSNRITYKTVKQTNNIFRI